MKNFYLYLTGLALFASGAEMVNRFTADSSKTQEWSMSRENRILAEKSASEKVPYARSRKTTKGSRMMFVPGITATNTYVISNDTGLSGGSAGDEITYTVTITNSGTDATGVVFSEPLDPNTTLVPGSVTASPIAVNDTYNTIGNVGLDIPAGSGLLSNDISPNATTLSITSSTTVTTAQGGTVTINATTGAFTYDAPAGFIGNDTFNYTIGNNSGTTSTATATITSTGAVWFIKSGAPAGGTGTLSKPFNSINAFQAINDNGSLHPKTGHLIFLYTGSYDGSVTLLSSQKLIGQGAGASILTIGPFSTPDGTNLLPSTGGDRPTVTSSATAVTLGAGNTIRGLDIGNTTGSKIAGTFTGTLTIREMALNGSGRALAVSGGTFDAQFSEVSSTSTSGGESVTVGAGGGSIAITTGTINASSNGAIRITGSSLALNVTFVSVSSSGTAKGVVVTGTSGSFQITGTGTTAGSGGTIQNITTRGMEFANASNITVKNVNMVNANTSDAASPITGLNNLSANAVIHAASVTNLSLDRVAITGTVSQIGVNLNAVSNFNFTNGSIANGGTLGSSEDGCIYAINTTGTCAITSSSFANAGGRGVYFDNTNTNLNQLSVLSSTFNNMDGASGIQMYARGTSNMKLRVASACTFTRCRTAGVEAYATDNAQLQADVLNSTFAPIDEVGTGIDIAASGSATAKFYVSGNTVSTWNGPAINFKTSGNGYVEGEVLSNTVTKTAQAGSAIRVSNDNASGHSVVRIKDNTINTWSTGNGIAVEALSSTGTQSDVTIDNNNVNMTGADGGYGIDVLLAGGGTNNAKICANIINNDIVPNSVNVYSARARSGVAGSTTMLLQGTGTTFTQTWVNGGNTPTTAPPPENTPANQSGSGLFVIGKYPNNTNVVCATPNVSPLPTLRMSAEELEIARVAEVKDTLASAAPATAKEVTAEPVKQAAPAVTASPARTAAAQAGETVTVNGTGSGFTIPAGKNVVIKFKATINNNIAPSVCQVSTQGTVSGSNFTSVLTDDPNVGGSNNPTVTPVVSTPVITFCPGDQVFSPDPGTCTSTKTFTATAEGCPAPTITYKVGVNTITFPYAFPAGETTVVVTASNGIGTAPTCSFKVTVTPTPVPPITDQPDAATICAGSGTSFTVATSQTGVTYQWQKKPFGGSFANITTGTNPTADDPTLTLSNVPAADNLSEYRCIITNPCNNSTSDAAVLTVNQITGSSVTGTTAVNQGASAPNVTFGATGGTLPYTFTYKVNNGTNQTVSTTGANTTATVSQPTSNVGVFTYELVTVTDAQNCTLTPPSAQTAVITVSNNLTANISGSTTACQNEPQPKITFTAVNGIAPFTFTYKINGGGDLQVSTTGANTTATVDVPTSSATTFTYSLTNVSGSGGASTPIAGQTATVTVNEKPTIVLSGQEYLCAPDNNSFTVFFTATPGATITTDKGTVDGSTVTGIPTGQTATIIATLAGCKDTLSASKDCSMPVTLVDFNGSKMENTVALKWQTSEETNSDRFEIQRSDNGKNWGTIGTEKSHGESFSLVSYTFVDNKPLNGENFYRLKMVDVDKTFTYSRIISVRFSELALKSELYPNPVSDLLTLKSTDWSQVKSVEMHNMTGTTVYKSGKTVSKTIDVKNLPVGMYILTITHKTGEVSNLKVLVNR